MQETIPQRRAWHPTPVFLPGESHGQRSRAGYSSQGHTDSDTTEATPHARVFDSLDPAAFGGVSACPAGKEMVSRSVPASESPSSIRENALLKKKAKRKTKQTSKQNQLKPRRSQHEVLR